MTILLEYSRVNYLCCHLVATQYTRRHFNIFNLKEYALLQRSMSLHRRSVTDASSTAGTRHCRASSQKRAGLDCMAAWENTHSACDHIADTDSQPSRTCRLPVQGRGRALMLDCSASYTTTATTMHTARSAVPTHIR